MSKVAKLVIDKCIGSNDEYALIFGYPDPNFSSNDCAKFLEDNANAETIDVEIRSVGGSVSQGFEIYDMLTTSGKTINTTAYKCNSIATVIFMAGSTRSISKNAEFIIHNPAIDPYALYGDRLTAEKLQEILDDVKSCEEKIFNFYAEKLGITDNEAKVTELKDLLSKESDLGSNGALDWGFATSIIAETVNMVKVKKVAMYSDAIAAIIKDSIKINTKDNMDIKALATELGSLKSMITDFVASFKKPEVKASVIEVEGGDSAYFEGDSIGVDTKVYSEEAMTTPYGNGDFTTSDGDTFTVVDGVVTVYTEKDTATATTEELNQTIEAQQTEITDLKNQLTEAKKVNDNMLSKFTAIEAKVEAFAKVVPGDGKFKASEGVETPAQKRVREARERRSIGK